jgi:hypothetical protein
LHFAFEFRVTNSEIATRNPQREILSFAHHASRFTLHEVHEMILEVESNENCADGCFARFKDAGPPRAVNQVRLYDRNPAGEWYRVTGWSDAPQDPACPAYAQLVEDSGSGSAYIVYGGLYGLRFKPLDDNAPWSLADSHQWGEAYLSLASERDLGYCD